MAVAMPDVVLTNHARDKKRASVAATFEVFPRLLGFNENVMLRGVTVDYNRNIVKFHFAGDGLAEYEETYIRDDGKPFSFISHEGQEAPEIIPPAWMERYEKYMLR